MDEKTLKLSHRNNKQICDYSSKLYPEFEKTEPCTCDKCRKKVIKHTGIFFIRRKNVGEYLKTFNPTQLIWSKSTKVDSNYSSLTFGKSKGKTIERVLIYPTPNIRKWIKDNSYDFTVVKNGKRKPIKDVKEKLYVALTRARHSVAIIYDYQEGESFEGITKWK